MLAKTQIHSNSDARTNVAIVDTSTSHNSTGILTALSVNARGDDWILDFGATNHVTPHADLLSNKEQLQLSNQ